MSFRKSFTFCAALVLGCAVSARAQLGVYGGVSGQRVSGITCPAADNPCASNDGTVRPYGGTFGAYYDFHTLGPVRVGGDVRGDVLTANKSADSSLGGRGIVRQYALLGGLRATIHTPIHIFLPYAEIAGGYSHNNDAGSPELYSNYGLVKGFVGVDVTILPFLDLRAIEFGAGEMFGPSSHSTQSIGAGLVFHMSR